MREIRRLLAPVAMLLAVSAQAVDFTAEVDRNEIAQDESVSLKLSIQSEKSGTVETPSFKAPDFEVIHQYQSQFAESYYENGRVGARFMRSFTFVLRPNSIGKKTISEIQVQTEGQILKSEDLFVRVTPGGAAAPPPPNYGSQGNGLRGSSKPSRAGEGVFVRAEVDKNRVVRGEQVMVSYFLLIRAPSYNAQPEKFPALNGFLKEEVDVPLIRGQLQEEIVTLDGGVYKKILLARYAAYPLKTGTLYIDPMTLKVMYNTPRADQIDEGEDLFSQFFRQLTPRTVVVKNAPVAVEVEDLPQEGRSANFSGAVGDFSILSAVNRYDLRVNEPVSLTVKIEGRGNLSIVEAPKLNLPDGIQLYESRSQSKEGRGGTGERVFEYLLVPRKEGEFEIPGVDFNFFDPRTRRYISRASDPIRIRVAPGDPQAVPPPVSFSTGETGREIPSPSKPIKKAPDLALENWVTPEKSYISLVSDYLSILLFLIATGVIGYLALPRVLEALRRKRFQGSQANARQRAWSRLRTLASERSSQPFADIVRAYEEIEARIFDAVESRYNVPLRALPRQEVREILVRDRGMPEDRWARLNELFEFVEMVRFAHRAGAVPEDRVRNELSHWIETAEKLETALIPDSQSP